MTLARDLLEQAAHLAAREGKRPRQASLRRAVSAAYYALFHLLTAEGARQVSPAKPEGLRSLTQRAYNHGDMRQVCLGFLASQKAFLRHGALAPNASPAHRFLAFPLEPGLSRVIETFLTLQEERHDADYNLNMHWNRADALNHVRAAREAFAAWSAIRDTPNATVFLSALLLQRQWGR